MAKLLVEERFISSLSLGSWIFLADTPVISNHCKKIYQPFSNSHDRDVGRIPLRYFAVERHVSSYDSSNVGQNPTYITFKLLYALLQSTSSGWFFTLITTHSLSSPSPSILPTNIKMNDYCQKKTSSFPFFPQTVVSLLSGSNFLVSWSDLLFIFHT